MLKTLLKTAEKIILSKHFSKQHNFYKILLSKHVSKLHNFYKILLSKHFSKLHNFYKILLSKHFAKLHDFYKISLKTHRRWARCILPSFLEYHLGHYKSSLSVACACFEFNIPPTAKVIWRRGQGFKSHLTDWRSQGSNRRSTGRIPGLQVEWFVYPLHHSGSTYW